MFLVIRRSHLDLIHDLVNEPRGGGRVTLFSFTYPRRGHKNEELTIFFLAFVLIYLLSIITSNSNDSLTLVKFLICRYDVILRMT